MEPLPRLTERQELVLRAVVAAYIGEVAPVGSRTVSHVLPVRLSAASIRNTMAELTELGLIEKPHRSAGRRPTEAGLRFFVDHVAVRDLEQFEQRELAGSVDEAGPDSLIRVTSRLLSERTRQLGFVLVPHASERVLQHVTLVRLSTSRLLAILVAQDGSATRRVIEDRESGDQAELDRMAAALSERVAGQTLAEVRRLLGQQVRSLRHRAFSLVERALLLGWRALEGEGGGEEPLDLVIATRLALLDQPEFRDLDRLRQLFEALEAEERLVRIIDKLVDAGQLRVALGGELDEPALRSFALVAAPYGAGASSGGVLGVIGPSRMDYPRVMALVDYLSRLVTEKLSA
jgi:heat-inducible transcriptional repressor